MPQDWKRSRHATPETEFPAIRSRLPLGNYGWLFRALPAWQPCEGQDPDPCLQELAKNLEDQDERFLTEHPELPAGYTYFGVLVGHDITFDPSSLGQRTNDPNRLYNFRTPSLDLDCVYGRGPLDQPYLYEEVDFASFRLEKGENPDDLYLPRLGQTAVIADPRNDENLILSQLHGAFMRFHNEVVKLLVQAPHLIDLGERDTYNTFLTANQLVRWHYQWIVLYDYLSRILDQEVWLRLRGVIDRFRSTRDPDLEFYRPSTAPYIPVEFSSAAFRFGHSMIRPFYRLSAGLADDLKAAPTAVKGSLPVMSIPDPKNRVRKGPELNLFGRRSLPRGWDIDWNEFFDLGISYPYQRAMRIDTRFASALSSIPASVTTPPLRSSKKSRSSSQIGPSRVSMPLSDLRRGVQNKLPSGEALARAMKLPKVFSKAELGLPDQRYSETPLFYYILKESELQHDGLRLGRLGSEIVGEVLVGLLLYDDNSFAAVDPSWKPVLADTPGKFGMAELLKFRAWKFIRDRTET